jgi:hypothetical protein
VHYYGLVMMGDKDLLPGIYLYLLSHPTGLLSKFFIYQLMHKRTALKRILNFTLKQL